jgi:lactate dehydrogenase-like 2-hydroxyacid dehydrogenase
MLRIGIVGMGVIGTAVAKAASGEMTRLPYLGDHVEEVPF